MSVSNPVRIGIIGGGAIAELFHLPALCKHPATAEHLVLVEPNEGRRTLMAERFGIQTVSPEYESIEDKVDGVIVATPPQSHFEICDWFVRRGKPVLCEKPLCEDLDQARQLVQTADAAGAALCVNQTRRFYPSYTKIRELIAGGELGPLQRIEYHEGFEFDWPAASPHYFRPDALGVWSDTGVHLLDTVCYWLGRSPQLIDSQNDSMGGPEAFAKVMLRDQDCDIELIVSRLGKLSNGFCITGQHASIRASMDETTRVVVEYNDGRRKTHRCGPATMAYAQHANAMLDNFVEVIGGKASPHVRGADVLGTIDLLQQAYDQATPLPMPWNQRLPEVFDRTPRVVLVTGAAGFVGGRVVESLLMGGNDVVPVAAIRKWSRAARLARHRAEIVVGDITSPEDVDRMMKRAHAVVHCAYADTREAIVDGTRNLLAAANRCGVERFVHLSTAEVYGNEVSGIIDETTPLPRTGRLYGDAKADAEDLCLQYRDKGMPVTILRPSIIYGPFSSWWSVTMARRIESGNWGMFADCGEGVANLIYVDDLVRAIFASLHDGRAAGQTFNVLGPDRVTWNQYFSQLNDALGRAPLKTLSATKSRLRTMMMDKIDFVADKVMDRFEDRLMEIYLRGGLASRMMKWLKGELSSTPSGDELNDLFARDVVYSDEQIRRVLDFKPLVDLNTGLQHTVAWMRMHRLAGMNADAMASRKVASNDREPIDQSNLAHTHPVPEVARR